jgi:virginiamycin B lyase
MRATKPSWARRRGLAIAVAVGLVALGGAALLHTLPQTWTSAARFVEYRMTDQQDAPIAIAAAADGTVWFTIDHADAIGRVRNNQIERLPTGGRNIEPTGLAVAADGSAWYTDIAARAVVRISNAGETSRFTLATPIVRLGRLAIAPDGAVWFADSTDLSVTRLKDGVFTRHGIGSPRGSPYGVATGSDGVVWATLQGANQLLRFAPDGSITPIDLPRPGAVPSDVAVGADGAVWFLQFRANRIGQLKDGKFADFEVGKENVGLSGLAVADDGAVWFGMMRRGSLGRLRGGRIDVFPLPRENARPYSLAVDREGNVWYADITGYVGMLPARQAR